MSPISGYLRGYLIFIFSDHFQIVKKYNMQKLCPLSFAITFLNHKKIDAYKNVYYMYLHTFCIFYAYFMTG